MAYLESTSGANFSSAQSVTGTAASTNIFDVTGAGSTNSPAMIGANGVNTALGFDIGSGTGVESPAVLITITAVTTVTGTLTIALQGAPDNGSYSPGTYITLNETAALTGSSQLFAGSQLMLRFSPIPPSLALPRFYRLNYTVSGSISLVLSANIVLDAQVIRIFQQYGSNFPSGL